MNVQETSEIREMTAEEVDVVNGGAVLDFGLFRVAATAFDGGAAKLCPGAPQYEPERDMQPVATV